MPIIDCPKCRERMQVDSSDLDDRVVCPLCDHRFAPRGDADDDLPRGRRPVRGRDEDDFDRPRKKKSSALLYIVLALVGVFVVLPCLGCIGFVIYVDRAKQSFTGTWTDHPVISVQGGATPVTASFPMTPVSGLLADPVGGGNGAKLSYSNMEQDGSVKDATFAIGYVDYPEGTTNPLDRGYLPLRGAIADAYMDNPLVGPTVVSETATTVSGYPAKEARYDKDGGDFTLRVVHVNDRPKNGPVRLVVILAGGTGLKDDDKQKFLNSVKIGKGK